MDNKKNVLITGSSRGIGAATAREFAKHGFNVVINYVSNQDAASDLKAELETNYHIKALVIKCDVSNEEEVKEMVKTIKKELGDLDVLVNNAGIAIDSTLEDKKVEDFKRILEVNLIGTYNTCKHIGTKMFKKKEGSILNVSSNAGIDAYYPYGMDYDASKAGVISLTHNFAVSYAPFVRVNSIAPGWVNTEMNKELNEEYIKEECKRILLNRFSEPEEIAKEIYHVAVESTYLNDAIIKIDGGRY